MHMASFILHDWCVLGLWTLKCFVRGVNAGKHERGLLYLQHFSKSIIGFSLIYFCLKPAVEGGKDYFGNYDSPFLILQCSISPDWESQWVLSCPCQSCQSARDEVFFFWKQDFWFCIYLQAKKTVLCYDYINAICWSCVWCFRSLFKEWFFVSLEAMHINIEIPFFFRLKHCPSIKLSC